MERSEFLGLITKCYQECICISGTHGKTTTTSMIATCFLEANLDPTIEVGAYLKTIKGNNRTGNSDYFILEACEYVDSFLQFFPKTEIILNIDENTMEGTENILCHKITYGMNHKADFEAKNITLNAYGYPTFDCYKKDTFYHCFTLNVRGSHNILNALACIATCDAYQISPSIIAKGLEKFTGANRRLLLKWVIMFTLMIMRIIQPKLKQL